VKDVIRLAWSSSNVYYHLSQAAYVSLISIYMLAVSWQSSRCDRTILDAYGAWCTTTRSKQVKT